MSADTSNTPGFFGYITSKLVIVLLWLCLYFLIENSPCLRVTVTGMAVMAASINSLLTSPQVFGVCCLFWV